MTAEEKKKVAVDFLRLAGQGHPREMQAALKPGGIHHNVYVQSGWEFCRVRYPSGRTQAIVDLRAPDVRTVMDEDLISVRPLSPGAA